MRVEDPQERISTNVELAVGSWPCGHARERVWRGAETVHDIHIRLSKKTHERLVAHLVRHPKAKNKSQLARLILEDGLGVSSEPDARLRFEPVLSRIDALDQRLATIDDRTRFAELALTEILGRRPGLAEDVRRRAQEA